jgi:hypothetical protein
MNAIVLHYNKALYCTASTDNSMSHIYVPCNKEGLPLQSDYNKTDFFINISNLPLILT